MRNNMFKIGQKVRIKEWFDMSLKLQDSYGINSYAIGVTGIVQRCNGTKYSSINSYDIILSNDKSHFAFEPELEPVVKVGEQLLLFDL